MKVGEARAELHDVPGDSELFAYINTPDGPRYIRVDGLSTGIRPLADKRLVYINGELYLPESALDGVDRALDLIKSELKTAKNYVDRIASALTGK